MKMLIPVAVIFAGCAPGPVVESHSLISEANHVAYQLEVALPDAYDENKSYPLVMLVDGYFHLDGLARFVQKHQNRGDMDDVILVGIGYEGLPFSLGNLGEISEKRRLDLTFPMAEGEGGGADAFHRALVDEMVPFIEEKYGTDPTDRALLGHSLGGLFALLSVVHFSDDEQPFGKVVAASPSIWWDDGRVLAYENEFAETATDLPIQLQIGAGALEGVVMNATTARMVEALRSRDYPGLSITTHSPKTGHEQSAVKIFQASMLELYP